MFTLSPEKQAALFNHDREEAKKQTCISWLSHLTDSFEHLLNLFAPNFSKHLKDYIDTCFVILRNLNQAELAALREYLNSDSEAMHQEEQQDILNEALLEDLKLKFTEIARGYPNIHGIIPGSISMGGDRAHDLEQDIATYVRANVYDDDEYHDQIYGFRNQTAKLFRMILNPILFVPKAHESFEWTYFYIGMQGVLAPIFRNLVVCSSSIIDTEQGYQESFWRMVDFKKDEDRISVMVEGSVIKTNFERIFSELCSFFDRRANDGLLPVNPEEKAGKLKSYTALRATNIQTTIEKSRRQKVTSYKDIIDIAAQIPELQKFPLELLPIISEYAVQQPFDGSVLLATVDYILGLVSYQPVLNAIGQTGFEQYFYEFLCNVDRLDVKHPRFVIGMLDLVSNLGREFSRTDLPISLDSITVLGERWVDNFSAMFIKAVLTHAKNPLDLINEPDINLDDIDPDDIDFIKVFYQLYARVLIERQHLQMKPIFQDFLDAAKTLIAAKSPTWREELVARADVLQNKLLELQAKCSRQPDAEGMNDMSTRFEIVAAIKLLKHIIMPLLSILAPVRPASTLGSIDSKYSSPTREPQVSSLGASSSTADVKSTSIINSSKRIRIFSDSTSDQTAQATEQRSERISSAASDATVVTGMHLLDLNDAKHDNKTQSENKPQEEETASGVRDRLNP